MQNIDYLVYWILARRKFSYKNIIEYYIQFYDYHVRFVHC